jgi:ferritin-like metal-binding protein YciE
MENLLLHEIKDLYNAEKQLTKALPKMAKAASSDELRTLFEEHLEETKQHVERLEQVFEKLGKPARGMKCKGMEGLIEEGEELIQEEGDDAVKDAALIGAAQRVEHYEMAGYGCARTYAELIGMSDVAHLLQSTLDEEKAADEKLNKLAMSQVNAQAQEQTSEAALAWRSRRIERRTLTVAYGGPPGGFFFCAHTAVIFCQNFLFANAQTPLAGFGPVVRHGSCFDAAPHCACNSMVRRLEQ